VNVERQARSRDDGGVKTLVVAFVLALGLMVSALQASFAETSTTATRTVEEQKTIDVYKRANQAVVFITTKTYEIDPFAFFDEVRPREGTGTGTIVDAGRGIVITNLHVVQEALQSRGTVEITLASGSTAEARLIGYDAETDMAVFQLRDPPAALVGLPYGDSSKLEVGQRVLAIGNPFGLYRSLTAGIISSTDRSMKTPAGAVLKGLIQTDAAINPGNSGGPLLDADGRLIGINTAILSQSGDSAGIGFAVPINTIKRILPEMIATGRVRRPRMGWQLVDTDQGPMVLRVMPDGVAARGGIRPIEQPVLRGQLRGFRRDIDSADLIYRINGERVHNREEVEDTIRGARPGQPMKLTVRRGGLYGGERDIELVPVWE
jgi:S1-C subfamily serine protease